MLIFDALLAIESTLFCIVGFYKLTNARFDFKRDIFYIIAFIIIINGPDIGNYILDKVVTYAILGVITIVTFNNRISSIRSLANFLIVNIFSVLMYLIIVTEATFINEQIIYQIVIQITCLIVFLIMLKLDVGNKLAKFKQKENITICIAVFLASILLIDTASGITDIRYTVEIFMAQLL